MTDQLTNREIDFEEFAAIGRRHASMFGKSYTHADMKAEGTRERPSKKGVYHLSDVPARARFSLAAKWQYDMKRAEENRAAVAAPARTDNLSVSINVGNAHLGDIRLDPTPIRDAVMRSLGKPIKPRIVRKHSNTTLDARGNVRLQFGSRVATWKGDTGRIASMTLEGQEVRRMVLLTDDLRTVVLVANGSCVVDMFDVRGLDQ